ncbi:MAG: SpoIIE family protein phosphatase [Bacteroidales bacterium]|nr:SpoIIE family protein phosphatase [Bacteroidales bacterium]
MRNIKGVFPVIFILLFYQNTFGFGQDYASFSSMQVKTPFFCFDAIDLAVDIFYFEFSDDPGPDNLLHKNGRHKYGFRNAPHNIDDLANDLKNQLYFLPVRDSIDVHSIGVPGLEMPRSLDEKVKAEAIDFIIVDDTILYFLFSTSIVKFYIESVTYKEFNFLDSNGNIVNAEGLRQLLFDPEDEILIVRTDNGLMYLNEDSGDLKKLGSPFKPYYIIFAFLVMLTLFYFLFKYRTQSLKISNRNLRRRGVMARQKLKQTEFFEIRNKHIEDSLNYAQRIQKALLISKTEIRKMYPDSFILQRPKDIVSGDFYWARRIENMIFLAVADCTGHGVPGAFMSLIGLEFFRHIIVSQRIYQPALILEEINRNFDLIFDNLEDMKIRDGMDLALSVFDANTNVMQFAGAFNPMYVLRNNEIIEIKGDRNILGPDFGFGRLPFNNHEIKIEEKDIVYMFSDGYADQFGGPEGKKFKYRRFRHLLLSIHEQPMDVQQAILENSINDWIGSNEQIDDILVVGCIPSSVR